MNHVAAKTETRFRYWAFISYSQRDADWAKRLHAFLESYRIPSALVGRSVNGAVVPRRLAPVFRDRDELPGSPDLGAKLRDALSASASLIVICSPSSAASTWVNEEIRFYKASGRSDRCFPVIVEGPAAEEGAPDRTAEVFPKALRFEVTPEGMLSDRAVEPLAADARDEMDGWQNACLKLVAGILGLGFDDLRRREQSRRRRQRIVRAIMAAAALALVACGYVALADADVPVPGGRSIRQDLDHYGVTLFRPVLNDRELTELARSIRASQRQRLLADVASGKIEQEKPLSAWVIGEVVGAAYRDPDARPDDLRKSLHLIDLLYRSTEPGKPDGHRLSESVDDVGNPGRAEPILWALMGLSTILARSDVLDQNERTTLERYLAISQKAVEPFYPVAEGGWNTAVRQTEPRRHFIYTTGIALHMLLELRAADQGWRGSRDRLERMIFDTATWLHGAFINEGGRPGWRRSLDDDRPPEAGITLLIHSALGRACADVGIAMPEHVLHSGTTLMANLRHRSYESSDPDIRFDVRMVDAAGATRTQVTVTRMIWYPWAVEGLVSWRRCARRFNMPPEVRRSFDRSLSHLLKNVGPDMLRDVMRPERPLWINAETYYGLGRAP